MTDERRGAPREHDGRPFAVAARPTGGEYQVRLVASRPRRLRPLLQRLRQPDAVVHPALPLGPLQRAGHPPQRDRGVRVRLQRRQRGPRAGRRRGDRGRRGAGRDGPRLPPLHAARRSSARARPDVFLHHFVHIPWTQPDAWRVLPTRDPRGDLPRAARQRHHRLPHALLPAQLPAVLPRPDGPRGRLRARASCTVDGREVWVRAYPLPIDHEATRAASPARARVARVRARAAAPPARLPDPARRPRRPVQERPARLLARSTCSSSSTRSSASASRSSPS